MVGILSQKYPHTVPELMAYQAKIVKCNHDFEDLAWAQYDWVYWRQVAQTNDPFESNTVQFVFRGKS